MDIGQAFSRTSVAVALSAVLGLFIVARMKAKQCGKAVFFATGLAVMPDFGCSINKRLPSV